MLKVMRPAGVLSEEFGIDIEDMKPFVVSEAVGREALCYVEDVMQSNPKSDRFPDMPFQLLSVEIEGENTPFLIISDHDGSFYAVDAVVITEISPGNCRPIFVARHGSIGVDGSFCETGKQSFLALGKMLDDNSPMIAFLNYIFSAIKEKRAEVGSVPARMQCKYKSGGAKKTYSPGNIIYIGSSKTEKPLIHGVGRVDWSHSWSVMGHWRRLHNPESIGVGRDGERNIEGFTWVNPYQKGSGPIKEKVRLLR